MGQFTIRIVNVPILQDQFGQIIFYVLYDFIIVVLLFRGILLTVPRVVQPGTEETACLMLHQFSRESDVDLQLFILQNENTITSEEHTFRHGGKLFHHNYTDNNFFKNNCYPCP